MRALPVKRFCGVMEPEITPELSGLEEQSRLWKSGLFRLLYRLPVQESSSAATDSVFSFPV